MSKAVLDLETGGWSIDKNGVCEISLTVVDENLNPVDTFTRLIKPYYRETGSTHFVSYKNDAMKANKLSVEILRSKGEPIYKVLTDLREVMIKYGVSTIIGHKVKVFDIPRMDYLGKRFLGWSFLDFECECIFEMAKDLVPGLPGYRLEDLCNHFGIVNKDPHRAGGDSIATLEVYKELVKLQIPA
jgi:DNA polymerase III subunit epsilon